MSEHIAPPTAGSKHSGIGIASFVLSIVGAALLVFTIMAAGAIEMTTPGGIEESSVAAVVIGLAIIGLLATQLVAFGMGIAALFQRERKKLFAILGAGCSFAFIALTGALMVIGLIIE